MNRRYLSFERLWLVYLLWTDGSSIAKVTPHVIVEMVLSTGTLYENCPTHQI
jgi:hypothetical protein